MNKRPPCSKVVLRCCSRPVLDSGYARAAQLTLLRLLCICCIADRLSLDVGLKVE